MPLAVRGTSSLHKRQFFFNKMKTKYFGENFKRVIIAQTASANIINIKVLPRSYFMASVREYLTICPED